MQVKFDFIDKEFEGFGGKHPFTFYKIKEEYLPTVGEIPKKMTKKQWRRHIRQARFY